MIRKHSNKFMVGGRYVSCQGCGMKYRHYECSKDWRGLYMCRDCWEPKHPQLIPPRIGHEQVPRVVLKDRTAWVNGVNLFLNPNFENYTGSQDSGVTGSFDDWTVAEESGVVSPSTVVKSGLSAIWFSNTGGDPGPYIHQSCTVVSAGTYTFSFYAKGDGTAQISYAIYDNTNSADIIATTESGVTGTEYQLVSTDFDAPAGCTSVKITLYGGSGSTGSCYLDGTKLIRKS